MDAGILNLPVGTATEPREQALRSEISRQLKHLEDDADVTSASDFYVAQKWDRLNTRLGLSTVGLSGAVGSHRSCCVDKRAGRLANLFYGSLYHISRRCDCDRFCSYVSKAFRTGRSLPRVCE